ncbi:Peptidase M20 domain-containing protein 2 [Araneus ventricosus]|uniref:Peptidase M20 domain-containing protein 2 n=1 Tax=Araneus ventricosus TaxID=182803 RepID=A0A4Y2EX85_ARAVE|nr:Peptidase M20 domain-containing protein 2 [Araneus ventricosus]
MTEEDFLLVSTKIEEEKANLNSVSQEIWKNPELAYQEVHAHDVLTSALSKYGFAVQRHYVKHTGFKAEYSSETGNGPVLAVLLEYDALPDIDHACGHNLIAEVGLAASLGIKAAMEADPTLAGKLLVLGSPAEERFGGKLDFIEAGVFEGVDAALMAHPCNCNVTFPSILSIIQVNVDFKGKEAHAAAAPWEGCNALDAAVSAYQSIALLRQQIKPTNRIHAIITKGGVAPNIIPAESRLEMYVRAVTRPELDDLVARVTNCINSGALGAGCTASIEMDEKHSYENLISNEVMGNLYDSYAKKLGIRPTAFPGGSVPPAGSTDMGNVSRIVPSIHPMFDIDTKAPNHTKEFAEASGHPKAQVATLAVAKALAVTALSLMRCPEILEEVKKKFKSDIQQGL